MSWLSADLEGRSPALNEAERLAGSIREALAADERPLTLRAACEAARVRVLQQQLRVGTRHHPAMLVPVEHGFNAIVDCAIWRDAESSERGRRRLRFMLAHELGHTLFYRRGHPPTRSSAPDRAEERFCHRFATSLLIPTAAARRTPVDPQGLHALAGRYDVTLRAAAWALARANRELSLLWLRHSEHPRRGGDWAMRVEWGASTRFVAIGESLKSRLASLAPGETGQEIERLRLGGRTETIDLQAWRFSSSMLLAVRHQSPDLLHGEGNARGQMPLFH